MFPPNSHPVIGGSGPEPEKRIRRLLFESHRRGARSAGSNVAIEMSATFNTNCRPAALSPDWSDRDAARVASKRHQWAHRFPWHRRILRIFAGFTSVRVFSAPTPLGRHPDQWVKG